MDQYGIDRTIVVAGGTVPPETLSKHFSQGGSVDVTVDNGAIKKECDKFPKRLLPFFFANPLHGVSDYVASGRSFYGLKLAPIVHGVPFSDPRMHQFILLAETFRHPVYAHCLPHQGFTVADYASLAAAFPNVNFILGHGGVGHGDFVGIGQIKPHPNIYFEISGSFTHATRVACKVLGTKRVIFGSEYPLQDHRVELTKLDCLDLSGEEREEVLRSNILRLLS
jgi:predicted TIM-barrel fold metal-dependent hydrolase